MKIKSTPIFFVFFGSTALALQKPESHLDKLSSAEERDLLLFESLRCGRTCRRQVDQCVSGVGGGGLPFEEWLIILNTTKADLFGIGDMLRDVIYEAETVTIEQAEGGARAAVNRDDALRVLGQVRDVVSSLNEENIRAATESLLDLFWASDQVFGPAFRNIRGIIISILNIILAILFVPVALVLLPILGILLFVAVTVGSIAALFILLQIFVGGGFRCAEGVSDMSALCRTDLLDCEFKRFLRDAISSLIDVATLLDDAAAVSDDESASP